MKIVDTYLLYKFIRKLTLPFADWKMHEVGLIDDQGNFIVEPEDRTDEQKASYSYLDMLVLNLKKLLAHLPAGTTRIATFAAALWMLREGQYYRSPDAHQLFEDDFSLYMAQAKVLYEDGEGGVPANNMGDGKIADKKQGLKYKPLMRRKGVKGDANVQ